MDPRGRDKERHHEVMQCRRTGFRVFSFYGNTGTGQPAYASPEPAEKTWIFVCILIDSST